MSITKALRKISSGKSPRADKLNLAGVVQGFSDHNPIMIDPETTDLNSFMEGAVYIYSALFGLEVKLVARGNWDFTESNSKIIELKLKAEDIQRGRFEVIQTLYFDTTAWELKQKERLDESRKAGYDFIYRGGQLRGNYGNTQGSRIMNRDWQASK